MDNKVLLQDLAQGVAMRASSQKKDADTFVRNVFDIITQYLKEDKIVKIKGLGTFKVIEVSGRDSVNVNTGERIHISGHSKISFTPDTSLRDQVNKPFLDFDTIILNEGVDVAEMERLPDINQSGDTSLEIANSSLEGSLEESSLVVSDSSEAHNDASATESVIDEQNAAKQDDIQKHESVPSPSDENSISSLDSSVTEEKADCQTNSMLEASSNDGVNNELSQDDSTMSPDQSEQSSTYSADAVATSCQLAGSCPNECKSHEEESILPNRLSTNNSTEKKDAIELHNESIAPSQDERIVYVERSTCKCHWITYVLLLLAMMALSYLAGRQQWFVGGELPEGQEECEQEMPYKQVLDDSLTSVVSTDEGKSSTSDTLEQTTDGTNMSNVADPALSTGSSSGIADSQNSFGSSTSSTKSKTLPDGNYKISGTKCAHLLKSGEGLYQLARIYYGNMNMARYIVSYNNIENPDIVPEGTVLKIPELQAISE